MIDFPMVLPITFCVGTQWNLSKSGILLKSVQIWQVYNLDSDCRVCTPKVRFSLILNIPYWEYSNYFFNGTTPSLMWFIILSTPNIELIQSLWSSWVGLLTIIVILDVPQWAKNLLWARKPRFGIILLEKTPKSSKNTSHPLHFLRFRDVQNFGGFQVFVEDFWCFLNRKHLEK